jgi:hypothetical protein
MRTRLANGLITVGEPLIHGIAQFAAELGHGATHGGLAAAPVQNAGRRPALVVGDYFAGMRSTGCSNAMKSTHGAALTHVPL